MNRILMRGCPSDGQIADTMAFSAVRMLAQAIVEW